MHDWRANWFYPIEAIKKRKRYEDRHEDRNSNGVGDGGAVWRGGRANAAGAFRGAAGWIDPKAENSKEKKVMAFFLLNHNSQKEINHVE